LLAIITLDLLEVILVSMQWYRRTPHKPHEMSLNSFIKPLGGDKESIPASKMVQQTCSVTCQPDMTKVLQ